jgi:hypothetical protein
MAGDPDRALANASVYLDAFGRIVAAWIWLKQALAAERGLASRPADGDRAMALANSTPFLQAFGHCVLAWIWLDVAVAAEAALLATDPDRALANASVYLDAFGRIVAAWVWLKQALAAERGLANHPGDADFYRGKLQAARYYLTWELPATAPQFDLLAEVNSVPLEMRDAWY